MHDAAFVDVLFTLLNAAFQLLLQQSWICTRLSPERALTLTLLYSLELNVHQIILTDLAASVGASKDEAADPTVSAAIDTVTSGVNTRAEKDAKEKVYMVRATRLLRLQALSAAHSLPRASAQTLASQSCP
jgi:hypothetical protein